MYWQKKWPEEDKDQALKDEILAIRDEHKDYGYRRIHLELKNRGQVVNKKKVQRLVQDMGLQVRSYGKKYKKYNSYKGVVGKIKKNRLNRRFNTSIPLQKITTDTTEFKYYEETLSRPLHGPVQSGNHQLHPIRSAQWSHHASRLRSSH